MSGAYAFTVLMFLRLVIVCRLTCLYPLLRFYVYRHSDEGSGRPAWPMLWDSNPLHLLIKVLRTRNMRVWRWRTNWCWSIVVRPRLLPLWLSPGVNGLSPSAVPGVQETRWGALVQRDRSRSVPPARISAAHMCTDRKHGSAEGNAARQVGDHTQSCVSWTAGWT